MAAESIGLITQLSNEIQCLQNDLLEVTDILKQRRETMDRHCGRCQELFKPWPQKVSLPYSFDEKETQQQETICKRDPEEEKEKQELAMLDDILAKAQQARELQTKFSKSSNKSSSSVKSAVLPGSKGAAKVPPSVVKEAKSKPKLTYPAVTRPSSAKSTYAASYKKVSKTKQLGSGTRRTPLAGSTSQARPTVTRPNDRQIPAGTESQNCLKRTNLSTEQPSSSSSAPDKPLSAPGDIDDESRSKPLHSKAATAERKFLLSEKGTVLTMPQKFVRVCKEHKRFLQRVRKIGASSFEGTGETFCAQVEGNFCPALSGPSSGSLRERVDRLVKEYEGLLGLARSTVLSLGSIDETSEYEVISRGVTSWEFITSKYEELNEEADRVTEGLCRFSHCCPCPKSSSSDVVGSGDVEKRIKRNQLISSTERDVWHSSNDDGFFTYLNSKELKILQKLSQDYEMTKYHLELRKRVGEKILPLLRELPTNHRLFIPLFRSVYSILCYDGRTFPTIVKDTFPDDELVW